MTQQITVRTLGANYKELQKKANIFGNFPKNMFPKLQSYKINYSK